MEVSPRWKMRLAGMGGIACLKKKSKRLDKLSAKQRPINLEALIWT